jgi:hypothetical protein
LTANKSAKLEAVGESDSDDHPRHHLQVLDHESEIPSIASSADNLAANTRANQHSNFKHNHNSKLNDISEHANGNQRRPSILLDMQEMISGRRPSALMASLRRGSQSILHSFRPKHDDPNSYIGAKSPEAIEYRRKNRRIGE